MLMDPYLVRFVCKAESNSLTAYLDNADRVHFPGMTVRLTA